MKCKHKNIVINPSLTTSVMAIQFSIFGFKCEDCGKQWDIGNMVDSLRVLDEYTGLLEAMARRDPRLDPIWMEQYAKAELEKLK